MNCRMKKVLMMLAASAALLSCGGVQTPVNTLRAPAYPLVTIDPYMSVWSWSDNLYDRAPRHWSNRAYPLTGVLTVDGESYRFMGDVVDTYRSILPTARAGAWTARYTFDPKKGKARHAKDWETGVGGFSSRENVLGYAHWPDDKPDIWVRRTFSGADVPAEGDLFLEVSLKDWGDFTLNGKEVASKVQRGERQRIPVSRDLIKEGENVLEAHGANPIGRALLDFGLIVRYKKAQPWPQTARQLVADVQATTTHYRFECGPVELAVDFTAPLLMEDLDLLSRPVNYLSYTVSPRDGKKHDVVLRLQAGPAWALDDVVSETAVLDAYKKDGLVWLKASNAVQKPLARCGDDVRINWGSFLMAAENGTATVEDGNLNWVREMPSVKGVSGKVMLGYDDGGNALQYFGENLPPYWNRDGKSSIEKQFVLANKEYKALMRSCRTFDLELYQEALEEGGRQYAELCALAYRQAVAAHKLVQAPSGELLWLSKENNSGGFIGTVDVAYPASPIFLKYNPALAEGLLTPIFEFSESGRWDKPYPAHDMGNFPLANGQTYPTDMPVEEGGNMLIMSAAVCKYSGKPDVARKHWETLTRWVGYLVEKGLDPENQLCTDDFAGHLAHNANLSVKAILGIASYGYMAGLLGYQDVEKEYMDRAREMAEKWEEMARDGDHYSLTFDRKGTWSQKYNMVWDEVLDFDIFSDEIMEKEIPYYLTKQNKYGLPLDSRATYTKTDWILWTASMAENSEDFQALVAPVWDFMNETVDRVPMTDWPFTDNPHRRGFKARSVVGGYFIKML